MPEAVLDNAGTATPVGTPEPQAPQEPPHNIPGQPEPNGAAVSDDDEGELSDEALEAIDSQGYRIGGLGKKAKKTLVREVIDQRKVVRALKEQVEQYTKTQQAPKPSGPKPVYEVPKVPTGEFVDEQPKLEQFADSEDPYGDWILARSEWSARKREHENVRQHQQSHINSMSRQQAEYWQGVESAHNQKLQARMASNPALLQAMADAGRLVQYGSLLDRAIVALDNRSVDVAEYLATNPAVLDEFVLLTDGKPVNEQTVATVRRLLLQRMPAETTGAVAPSPVLPITPRPPTPVRTGATRTGTEPPADGASSISEHARHYAPKAR